MYLSAFLFLVWRNVYLDILPIFPLSCLFFCCWVVWAVCLFWNQALIGQIICKYFLPLCRLSFCFGFLFLGQNIEERRLAWVLDYMILKSLQHLFAFYYKSISSLVSNLTIHFRSYILPPLNEFCKIGMSKQTTVWFEWYKTNPGKTHGNFIVQYFIFFIYDQSVALFYYLKVFFKGLLLFSH